MKTEKIEAYVSQEGNIFRTHEEAITDNIEVILNEMLDCQQLINLCLYIKANKNEIRYVIDNIDKVNLEQNELDT